jgi:anti-anti-sigma factor
MNASIENLPNMTCIRPSGRLDFEAAASFQTQVDQAIAESVKRQAPVVMDCNGLEYVSSAGLRVFLVAARAAKAGSVAFIVCSLTPSVKEVFDVSGFGRIIDVQADFATASAKITGA